MNIKDRIGKIKASIGAKLSRHQADPRVRIKVILLAEEQAHDFAEKFGKDAKLVSEYMEVFRRSIKDIR